MSGGCRLATLLVFLCAGCGSGGAGTPTPGPPPGPPPGPWDFPASSRFAITLVSDQATYAVGDSIDVGVVCYNLDQVFGAAFAVNYAPSQLEARGFLENPAFFAPDSTAGDPPLSVLRIDDANSADPDTVSYGFSYLRGSGDVFAGSGMLLKIRFLAVGAGTAVLAFDPATIDFRKADGSPIDNFPALARDSLEVSIR